MPLKTSSGAKRKKNVATAAGAILREDSDDELGLEDHPWQWIYAKDVDEQKDFKGKSQIAEPDEIVGARMGQFSCRVGDCVFLKGEGVNEAWVAILCSFQEDKDGEKNANFMWFSTEREIRNKQKKRTDFLPNEVYITPFGDANPLVSINGKATVVSPRAFHAKYPSGKIPRSSKDFGKLFVCRRGCNTRKVAYTDEFIWEDVYRGYEDIDNLFEMVDRQTTTITTKITKKRKREQSYEDEEADDLDDPYGAPPKTPSKKRKLQQPTTPTSKSVKRTPQKFTTPTHRRIVSKRPLEFTPLGTRILSPNHITSSPFQIARTNLHVSSVPDILPCRNTEFTTVYTHLEAAITDGSGACIYISGTPGTGKTATVREVIAQLNASVMAEELDDFIFVEINGMKVTDPHQAYSLLWEALKEQRVSPTHALSLLEREFDHPSPRRVPCVVLMDELDQLVTKNQSVMYNFFNWPSLRHSRLIVLAVANTMDLPERTLSNKISSRLGLTRITFPGYTHDQLQQIIQSRLSSVPGKIVDPDAIQFASRKVAAVSGDARRALDICRRAVEIAEAESESSAQNPLLNTPSKRAKPRPNLGLGNINEEGASNTERSLRKTTGIVTIATVKQAIKEATHSPLQQYLKSIPLAAKLFLAALLARSRRTGVSECVLGDVIQEAKRLALMAAENPLVQDILLTDTITTTSTHDGGAKLRNNRHPAPATTAVVGRVLGMGLAAEELVEAGLILLEVGKRGERGRKVRIGIDEIEVRTALRDDGETRGLGFGA